MDLVFSKYNVCEDIRNKIAFYIHKNFQNDINDEIRFRCEEKNLIINLIERLTPLINQSLILETIDTLF